jgi:hypothetical protein
MVPQGLAPGSEFYVMFYTSSTRDATSTDIADYDTHAQQAAVSCGSGNYGANAAIFNTAPNQWKVVGATAAVDQCDPFKGDTAVPLYGITGLKIADNAADFQDGTIVNQVYSVDGTVGSHFPIYTGCLINGTKQPTTVLGAGSVTYGFLDSTTAEEYVDDSSNLATNPARFYAVSPKLTVPGAVSASTSVNKW